MNIMISYHRLVRTFLRGVTDVMTNNHKTDIISIFNLLVER